MSLIGKFKEKQYFINKVIEDLDIDLHSLLKTPMKYSLQAGGKRLRPLICMLSAEVLGGNYKETKDAFLALELIHNGTLVHDDIIDEDLFRRGTPSIFVKFGGKRAVITGDVLLSSGLKYATKTGNLSIVSWLSDTTSKMLQGVILQTFNRRKVISEETYWDIAYLKSGSLFEAAAAIGALVVSKSEGPVKLLAEFGRNFGMAYQIRDDICGVFSENKSDELSRSDIINGDPNLPLIYGLQSEAISEGDRKYLMDTFLGQQELIDEEEIKRIYEETGALERSMEKMKNYNDRSRELLNNLPRTEAEEHIHYLLDEYYEDFNPKKKIEIAI